MAQGKGGLMEFPAFQSVGRKLWALQAMGL